MDIKQLKLNTTYNVTRGFNIMVERILNIEIQAFLKTKTDCFFFTGEVQTDAELLKQMPVEFEENSEKWKVKDFFKTMK